MLNISTALTHAGIRNDTRLGAVQDVGGLFAETSESARIKLGTSLVDVLLGVPVAFADEHQALLTTQYIVDAALCNQCNVEDPDVALSAALSKAEAFVSKESNKWIFAKPEPSAVSGVQEQFSEKVETTVAVKADGSIKKGGRQVLAQALYQKYVVEPAEKPTNVWFKQLLSKELKMSDAGASTYAFNCDRELQLLVKASRKKAE